MSLKDHLPANPDDFLALSPEEVAEGLFAYLRSLSGPTSPNRYSMGLPYPLEGYPPEQFERLSKAVMEAWMCLERDGLVAPKPGSRDDFYFITRRGMALAERGGWPQLRAARLLPRELLHPVIEREARPEFVRGDYESAVFKAFKAVEVAVRKAAELPNSSYGVPLMRKAFDPASGRLTDKSAEPAEREALGHLFAGAIGVFKNPPSHRYVNPEDPAAVVEEIMLASRLMRFVDERQRSSEDTGT